MTTRVRVGLLTPSSNTIMEPRAAQLVSELDGVSVHFGRFSVTRISMGEDALGQFKFAPQIAAAELLADAKCDVIAWGGTSGGWLGVDNDRKLCAAISERTGVPSTTSTLATLDGFRAFGAKTYALATPYLDEIQQAIIANFGALNFDCVAERHLEDPGNFSFSGYGEPIIADLVREVALHHPQAIAVFCTNFDGPGIAPEIERDINIPVLDSISVTLWHALRLVNFDTSAMAKWGKIFSCPLPDRAGQSPQRDQIKSHHQHPNQQGEYK